MLALVDFPLTTFVPFEDFGLMALEELDFGCFDATFSELFLAANAVFMYLTLQTSLDGHAGLLR